MIPWGLDMIWRRTWETYETLEKPTQSKLFFGTGRTPARRHEVGCEMALEWGASHILILGGDQVYPEQDMIRRMIKWMEYTDLESWTNRKKVVNCLVPIRGHRPGQGTRPFQPIGMRLDSDTNELVPITREDPPIVRTEVIGTGVMLFEADILNGLKQPWFGDQLMPGSNSVQKMQDVAFVEKLNNAGFQVWCDTQIIVKHLGVLEIDDSFQFRFQ
jgi:GT2 family glycosyltransferase